MYTTYMIKNQGKKTGRSMIGTSRITVINNKLSMAHSGFWNPHHKSDNIRCNVTFLCFKNRILHGFYKVIDIRTGFFSVLLYYLYDCRADYRTVGYGSHGLSLFGI